MKLMLRMLYIPVLVIEIAVTFVLSLPMVLFFGQIGIEMAAKPMDEVNAELVKTWRAIRRDLERA